MRIHSMVINGFGKFHNVSFQLDGPVSLFYGHNEAGKSTIMGFIRAILFGFPTRRHMHERYEPLYGGQHGGMIILTDDQGQQFRVERYADQKVKVTLDDGTIKDELFLHKLLGEMTADVFHSLFAFSLSELQELNTLQSDEVSGFLFHVGTGASAGKILDAEKKIAQEMERVFKPKGRNQELQLLLKEMEETRSEIQLNKESLGQYHRKMEELKQLELEVKQIDEAMQAEENQLAWIQKCLKTYNSWMQLLEMRKELEELPERNDFLLAADEQYKKLLDENERLELELRKQQAKLNVLKQQAATLSIDQRLLDKASELTHLHDLISSYQANKQAITEHELDMQHTQDELDSMIRRVNKSWTEKDLVHFSTSLQELEQVHGYKERMAAAVKKEQRRRQEQQQKEQQELFDRFIEEKNQIIQHQRALEEQREAQTAEPHQEGWWTRGLFVAFAMVLAILLPVYFLWNKEWMPAMISFVLSMAIVALLIRQRRLGQAQTAKADWQLITELNQEIAAAEEQVQLKEQQMKQLISAVPIPLTPEEIVLDEEQPSEEIMQLTAEWRAWLRAQGLHEKLSPDTVLELFRIAEQGLKLIAVKEKQERKLQSLHDAVTAFEQQARQSFQLADNLDVVAELRRLKLELERQQELITKRTSMEQQLQEQAEEARQTELSQTLTKQKISKLLQDTGAADDVQFHRLVSANKRSQQLSDEIRRIEVYLEQWVGAEHRQALDQQLEQHNSDQLEQLAVLQKEQIKTLKDQANTLREQRGKLQTEMEQLRSGQHYTMKLQQYEEQQAKFQTLAGEWAVNAFCLELFRQAKDLYEREKQPGVLMRASQYFSMLTNQKFQRVMAPIGEKRILVERASGEVVDTEFLSRGTAEQLYLAMRFALAEAYSLKAALPLVMDDVFVNFDRPRLQQTLDVLRGVSEDKQLILFTCHPHVRDELLASIPIAQLIRL